PRVQVREAAALPPPSPEDAYHPAGAQAPAGGGRSSRDRRPEDGAGHGSRAVPHSRSSSDRSGPFVASTSAPRDPPCERGGLLLRRAQRGDECLAGPPPGVQEHAPPERGPRGVAPGRIRRGAPRRGGNGERPRDERSVTVAPFGRRLLGVAGTWLLLCGS